MRINHDLFRKMLILVADSDGTVDIETSSFYHLHDNYNLVGYHVSLLIQAGFIRGIDARCVDGQYDYACIELTYKGQIYLEYIENDNVWNKLKQYLKDNALPFSITAIEAYVKHSL